MSSRGYYNTGGTVIMSGTTTCPSSYNIGYSSGTASTSNYTPMPDPPKVTKVKAQPKAVLPKTTQKFHERPSETLTKGLHGLGLI